MAITISRCTVVRVAAMGALVWLGAVRGLAAGAVGADGVGQSVHPAAVRALLLAAAGSKAELKVEHVDVAGAAKLVEGKVPLVVLDVRTPREFKAGHIAGATNINFNADSFAEVLGRLDRDKTYLVHCAAGGRSTKSLETFRKLGFRSVIHLDGGFAAWEAAGKPVAR